MNPLFGMQFNVTLKMKTTVSRTTHHTVKISTVLEWGVHMTTV